MFVQAQAVLTRFMCYNYSWRCWTKMVRSFRRNCSGQVIVVTALLVAVILLTTAMYVIEVQKNTPTVQSDNGVLIDSYQNSVRSTAISALANFSSGGNSAVFDSDLAKLRNVILAHSYEAQLTMTYNLFGSSGYSDGLRVWWGSFGEGVSSAYATVTCGSLCSMGSSEVTYVVNVTDSIQVSGSYLQSNDTHKQVNLTIHLENEAGGALADSFVINYMNASSWVTPEWSSINSNGDGTYTVSFYSQTGQTGEPLDVSVVCIDTRGISVGANVTCSRVT
jgi:hypothetical protein